MGKQIIILGMHRSGTSLLTRLVTMMGAYFGSEELHTGANRENPKGFWERRDIRELNDLLLTSAGADWDRVAGFTAEAVLAGDRAVFRERAKNIIAELDAHTPWVIKEPRLCVLFSIWRELLAAPVCVLMWRNPLEVALSLKSRNAIPLQFGLALWEYYTLASIRASSGLPRILLSYAELMAEPDRTVETLADFFKNSGIVGLRSPGINDIEQFVDKSLYRERAQVKEACTYLNDEQKKLFYGLQDHTILQAQTPLRLSESARESLNSLTYLRGLQEKRELLQTFCNWSERLFASRQYQLGRMVGGVCRSLLSERNFVSLPERKLREAVEASSRCINKISEGSSSYK